MKHQHTKPPENESLLKATSIDGDEKIESGSVLNPFPKKGCAGNQYATTGLISAEDEVFIETICVDRFEGENRMTDSSPSVLNRTTKPERDDQEKLLNSTFSGVDLGMVQELLHTESYENAPLKTLNDTNMSTCINENLNSSGLKSEENSIDHPSKMDTEEDPSYNMGFKSMRDLVDNSARNVVKNVSESDGNIKNDPFYETNGHVFDCYIENDISGMHNVDAESEGPISGSTEDVAIKEFNEDTNNSDNKNSGVFRKSGKKFKVLEESVVRIIRDYPLISEFEIGEHLKETEITYSVKLDKKGIVKILKHLKLESSYERFRYYIKA